MMVMPADVGFCLVFFFLFLQHNDVVVIKSIEISQETTLRVDRDGIGHDGMAYDSLSPQLHVSKVSEDFVVLDPGQGAIVPLTFLPRFPPLKSEGDTLVTLPSDLSPWQQADREGWIGSVSIRNNLGYEMEELERYRVTTMLLVETNFGVARIPFDANSVRDNPYSLPDVIYFSSAMVHDPSSEPFQSYVAENGIRIIDSHWNISPAEATEPDPDCYDLYLRHPEDSVSSIDIYIQEVAVSRPENVSLRILPEKDTESNLIATGPRQSIREWTEQGALLITPDDEQHYIATICNEAALGVRPQDEEHSVEENTRWMDPDDVEGSLGFVQIRTESETLYVSLFESEASRKESRALRYFSDDAEFTTRYNLSTSSEDSIVRGYPDKLEVYLVNGTADTASILIGLNNTNNSDITVMKTTIAFEDEAADVIDDLDIQLAMKPAGLEDNKWVLKSGEIMDGAFSVNISWDLSEIVSNTTELHGRVLVQGSTKYNTSGSWAKGAILDPSLDADIVSEIPFLVRCVKGRIGISRQKSTLSNSILSHASHENPPTSAAVDAMFFPLFNGDLDALHEKNETRSTSTGLEHELHAYSTINASLSLKDVHIEDANGTVVDGAGSDPCNRFNVVFGSDEHFEASLGEGISDLGIVLIRYDFPQKVKKDEPSDIFPTECFLSVSTRPETGKHTIPLLVYTGRVDISVDDVLKTRDSGDFVPPFLEDQNRIHSVVGFPQLLDWFQNSKAGQALRFLLRSKRAENDKALLSHYLSGLSMKSRDLDSFFLNPVLLKVGAMNPDEKEIIPLFITNYNPVPTLLRIDVGEVEGLRMSLGRNPVKGHESSILAKSPSRLETGDDAQKISHGQFEGQPVEGLRRFLQSDPRAQSLLSFDFHDAIEMSENAASMKPLLKEIFSSQSALEYHKDATPPDSSFSADCREFGVSQPYSKFISKVRGRNHIGPVTISPDSKSVRSLPVCANATLSVVNESSIPTIVLPAGGVARIDITLHSPPVALLDHDISQFLATGLVLTTQNGEVVPILVTFETPRGKLDVSPDYGADGLDRYSGQGVHALRIPAGMFNARSPPDETIVRIPPKSKQLDGIIVSDVVSLNASNSEAGVSLYMTSSFKRPVELLDVVSCNPLFEVVLRNGSVANDPILGVNIGKIKSVVPCAAPPEMQKLLLGYPSFFLCALNWVLGRKALQPQGCGGRLPMENQMNVTDTRDAARLDYDMTNRAFSRALFISAWSRSEQRSPDGIVAPATVDAVAKAWNIWKFGLESNLLRLSTSLRAIIRYNSTAFERSGQQDSTHVLSLAMANLTIDSILEMPTLMNHARSADQSLTEPKVITVGFRPTYVGEVSSAMIPVSNPTAAPVTVRLAVAPALEDFENYVGKDALRIPASVRQEFLTQHEAPYTQSGLKAKSSLEYVSQQWWDGSGSFFLADFWGGLVRSHYNITVRAASGALVSLLSPGLLSNSAFIAGCGSRCAIKDEVVKFDGPHDVRSTSFIGASAAERAVLMGQQRPSKDQNGGSVSSGRSMHFKAGGSMLTGGKGPAPFSIPFFALKEEVEIPPYGTAELGPVLFRPPGRTKYMGCESSHSTILPPHCDDEGFTSTLFLENSLTGLEHVMLRGNAVWERVVFQDIPLQDGIDSFSDIEMRNGRDSLIFPGTAEFRLYGSPAVVKHLMVKNVGDLSVAFSPPFLTSTTDLHLKTELWDKGVCSLGEFTLHPCSRSDIPIHLNPGENYSFFVQHEPRCTQLSSFVALMLEYRRDEDDGAGAFSTFRRTRSRRRVFRKSREELLLGYKMDASELSRCISSGGHVVFSFLDAMNKLGLKRPEHNIFEGYGMVAILAFALTYTFIILVITASGLILVRKLVWRLTTSSAFGRRLLGGNQRPSMILSSESSWLSSLRCLSRIDPLSQDLQTLGREQTRLVLLQQFRMHSVLPPLCLTASGLFQRERSHSTRHFGSRSGISSGGSERIRTLSDAIFKNGQVCFSASRGLVSFGAGWKTALARGVINDFSIQRLKAELMTEQLLHLRRDHPGIASEEESLELDCSSSIENDIDSSEASYLSNEDTENDLNTRQSRDSVDQEIDEDDSDSDLMEGNFPTESRVGKTVYPAVKERSLGHTKAAQPSVPDVPVSRNEAAEYTKVMHKGKSSKKSARPLSAVRNDDVSESGQKNSGTAATEPNLKNRSGRPTEQTSTKVLVKNAKRKVTKTSNGRLSAKATPFEPRPLDAVDGKSATVEPQESILGPSQPNVRVPRTLPPPPGFERSDGGPQGQDPAHSRTQGQLPTDDFSASHEFGGPSNVPHLPIPGVGPSVISGGDIGAASPARSALGGELASGQDDLIGSLLVGSTSPPPPPSASHFNSEDGFDIMDFLDGVLNEGSVQPEVPSEQIHDGAALNDVPNPPLVQVPLNPWAAGTDGNEFRSRAAAYGINFDEDTSERTAEGVLVDLPMLTPAAILGHQDDEEKHDTQSSLLK